MHSHGHNNVQILWELPTKIGLIKGLYIMTWIPFLTLQDPESHSDSSGILEKKKNENYCSATPDSTLLFSSSEKLFPAVHGNKYRDTRLDNVQRVSDLETLSPKWMSLSNSFH